MEKKKGKEVNEGIGKKIFNNNEIVFATEDFTFDYLDNENEEIDGAYAMIIYDYDYPIFCCTDGISYDLPCGNFYYDEKNHIYYMNAEAFECFEKLPQNTEEIEVKGIEVDEKKNTFYIICKTDKDEIVKAYLVNYFDNYHFEFNNRYFDENFAYVLNNELRNYIFDNAINEIDYDAYKYATQSHAIAKEIILQDIDKTHFIYLYNVNLDGTGNSFWGGFYFEDYKIENNKMEVK